MRLPLLALLVACAGSTAPSTVATPGSTSVTSVTSVTAEDIAEVMSPVTTESEPELPEGWSWSAVAADSLPFYDYPGATAPTAWLDPFTPLGSQRVVHVIEERTDGWLRVLIPTRPNGTTGWVRTEDVTLFPVERSVVVDLSERTLVVYKGTEAELTTAVAIGRPANPTPTGEFFVTDSVILSNPNGPWGPHAFGLSAFSDTITEFNGGDAVVAIHGTNAPSSIGRAQSLGCVRVPNSIALELSTLLSAGVPVTIRR